VALLGVGVVHGELASLLWGGAFGFLWAYVVVARGAVAWLMRKPGPQGTLEGLPGGGLVFRWAQQPPVPAFFGWRLRAHGEHSPGRTFDREVPLVDPVTEVALPLPRGVYSVVVRWELVDAFGFTRLIPPARWTTVLTVEPRGRFFEPPPPPPHRHGRWRPRRSGRRAGDPFDVRPYLPGDDLRRFHWPLFAHSGQPFVRTAEPSPPPAGFVFLVVDTEAETEEVLDGRLESLVTWVTTLDHQKTGWTVVVPSAQVTVTEVSALAPALAALTPRPLPDRAVEASWPSDITLLTGPSPAGRRLAQQLAPHRRLHVVAVAPDAPAAPAPRTWWRRL